MVTAVTIRELAAAIVDAREAGNDDDANALHLDLDSRMRHMLTTGVLEGMTVQPEMVIV